MWTGASASASHNNDFTELDDTGYMLQNSLKGKPEDYGTDHEDVRLRGCMPSRADDLMVLVQRMIGQTIWVVTERSNYAGLQSDPVIVTLECRAVGKSQIAQGSVRVKSLAGYEGRGSRGLPVRSHFVSDNGNNTEKFCGAAFWNICRYEVASVRMIRPADTIEFGIRSTVWNRANGLCNFNAILQLQGPGRSRHGQHQCHDASSPNSLFRGRHVSRSGCDRWLSSRTTRTTNHNPGCGSIRCCASSGDSPREMYNYALACGTDARPLRVPVYPTHRF